MNRVIAVFANNGTMATTQTPLWQYDYGQILVIQGLQLPQAYEVHFCNSTDTTTITSVGNADGVEIPDQFLRSGERIYAYVYLHAGEDDGETEYKITIPVMDRAEPTDIGPTPAQESTIGQLISALNDAVDTAEEAASKGPIIQDDYWYIWDSTAGEYVNTNVKAVGVDGKDGEDGEDGNNAWTIDAENTRVVGIYIQCPKAYLVGPSGATAKAGDVVFISDGRFTQIARIVGQRADTTLIGDLHGADGAPGQDGVSPEVTITSITGGHRVTITDADHPFGQTFDVMDGEQGSPGDPGDSGTKIWYTRSSVQTISGVIQTSRSNMAGQEGTPVDGDYVFGPAVGAGSGDPTDLYEITDAEYAMCSLSWVCKVKGADGGGGGSSIEPYTSNPAALGTASPGSSDKYARGDHVHAKPTASDVGAIPAPASPSSAQDLVYLNGAWVAADKVYIVNCTPTAPDYSGTMDKTVAEIYAASNSGKTIVFRVYTSVSSYVDAISTQIWETGVSTYPMYVAYIVNDDNLICATAGATDIGTTTDYETLIYPLPTYTCIPAPSSASVGDFLVYTSNGWEAQSLSTWQGGNY